MSQFRIALTVVALLVGSGVWYLNHQEDLEFRSRLLVDDTDNKSEKSGEAAVEVKSFTLATDRTAPELADPVQLQANGEPIDIGKLSGIAHAGPCVADVDGDGDRDLLVGDFPGYFWYFKNETDDRQPQYTSIGKLQAGNTDAKTPVY